MLSCIAFLYKSTTNLYMKNDFRHNVPSDYKSMQSLSGTMTTKGLH